MGRRGKKGVGPPPEPGPDPKIVGAHWRAKMRADCECVEALVWKRTFKLFQIDLADEKQASDMQVFLLLSPLMFLKRVTVTSLKKHIDDRVPRLFPGLK